MFLFLLFLFFSASIAVFLPLVYVVLCTALVVFPSVVIVGDI